MALGSETVNDATRAEMVRLAEEGQRLCAELLPLATEARRKPGSDHHVLNAFEFVLLFQFELNTCLKSVTQAKPGLEAQVHAQFMILTVYESLLTMRRLLAKRFRTQLVAALGEPTLDRRLKLLHSAVEKLFQLCKARFGEVRNGLVAHRDEDPDVRLSLLERVDVDMAVMLVRETLGLLNQFHPELLEYARHMAPGAASRKAR